MGGSVPSQKSTFSVAPQEAKIGAGAVLTTASKTWHRYRIPRISGLAQQMQANLPPENGSVITATGTYKFGAFVGSEIDLIPRVEDSIGWLLEAALGVASSVADSTYTASGFVPGPTGVNAHLFRFKPDDSSFQPWIAVRRTIPNSDGTSDGEVGYDCKVGSLRINVPAGGLMNARLGIVGRAFFSEDPVSWSYAESFEGSESIPQGMRGSLKLAGQPLPVTGLSIEISNGLSTPQQEMIIGEFNPDDFVALYRGCTIRAVYKWANADLYEKILYGGVGNVVWSSEPFITKTVGTDRAFQAEFWASTDIPGSSPAQPYKMKIFANKVAWQFDAAGIELQAGEILMLPFVGTVLDTGDGSDYFQIAIENAADNYTWPT